MAQTCFGNSRRFCPMIRPLFQARRFGVTAGSWTLGMICPSNLPPYPDISTGLNGRCPKAQLRSIPSGGFGCNQPILTDVAKFTKFGLVKWSLRYFLNVRSLLRHATSKFEQTRHFPCCAVAARRCNDGEGSNLLFAADWIKVRFELRRGPAPPTSKKFRFLGVW